MIDDEDRERAEHGYLPSPLQAFFLDMFLILVVLAGIGAGVWWLFG